ncbi:hypothetical protein JW916_11880 [Candidatus Sumerlaeota bacterium]|nr:hypothetical protein [Candidatus Sumerlaeota bacterium]
MGKKKTEKYRDLVEAATGVSSLWLEFRKCLRRAFTPGEVPVEEEQKFLEIKSNLARLQRVLSQNLPEGFKYGSKRIAQIMSQAVSIGTVQDLPANDKMTLYNRWHDCYISLQNLVGILDVLNDGYPVRFETVHAKSDNLKERLGAVSTTKKKDQKSLVVGVVVVAAIVVAFVLKSRGVF